MRIFYSPRVLRALSGVTLVLMLLSSTTGVALAESTWDPTAFVNTESFQTIDAGDGTTNIEVQFGDSGNRKLLYDIGNNRFQFTAPLFVSGNITATGSLSVKRSISGATLRVDGNADIWGALSATGAIKTKSNLTINSDSDTNDAVLTFGNQSTDRTLKFLNTAQKFQFNKDLSVIGNLSGSSLTVDGVSTFNGVATHTANVKVRGNLSGTTLTVDGVSTMNGVATHNANVKVRGNLSGSSLTVDALRSCDSIDTDANGNTVCGTDATGLTQSPADARYVNTSGDTMTGSLKVRANLSGSTLTVDGNAGIYGTLTTSGAITTKSNNLTINTTNNSSDTIVTFGNQAASQTLKFTHTNQRFEFSKDVKVTGFVRASGNLSGSTLNVDGTLNWRGQAYVAPTSQGANTFLKTDGAGNLTWASPAVGNGSGNILALRPAYPNAIYFASGSTSIGKLKGKQDTTNTQNYYRWTTSKAALNDFWTAVQVQIPKNFSHFETASGMILRLRTSTTSAADNYVTIRVKDTAGNTVALTNNASLVSSTANTWRTLTIGGLTSGTYTPGSDITIYIKTAATSAGFTDHGSITLNWASTTP